MNTKQPIPPGLAESVMRRLREFTGLMGTNDASAAGAANTLQQQKAYRDYQIKAAESGQDAQPFEEWRRNPR